MKTTKRTRFRPSKKQRQPLYPNAADSSYFVEKAVNIVTAIVSGMGFVSGMLFLLTLG